MTGARTAALVRYNPTVDLVFGDQNGLLETSKDTQKRMFAVCSEISLNNAILEGFFWDTFMFNQLNFVEMNEIT